MASAQKVVQAYYEAINAHDPDAMVQCCAEDIEVTFPEAKRNWKSRATAHEKFRSMFKNLPGFAAKWKFEDEAVKDIVSPPSQMLSTMSEICDETKFIREVNTPNLNDFEDAMLLVPAVKLAHPKPRYDGWVYQHRIMCAG